LDKGKNNRCVNSMYLMPRNRCV